MSTCSLWIPDVKVTVDCSSGEKIEVVKASNRKTYLKLFGGGRWWYYPMRDKENLAKYHLGRYSRVVLRGVMYRPSWIDDNQPAVSFIF